MYMNISELSSKNDHCAVVILISQLAIIIYNVIHITQLITNVSIQYTLVNYCITGSNKSTKAGPCP